MFLCLGMILYILGYFTFYILYYLGCLSSILDVGYSEIQICLLSMYYVILILASIVRVWAPSVAFPTCGALPH